MMSIIILSILLIISYSNQDLKLEELELGVQKENPRTEVVAKMHITL